MFTDTSFGEDIVGIKSELFMTNPFPDNDKLSTPYLSSCMAADITSLSMVESDVSGGDLLSGFRSICVSEPVEQRNEVALNIRADTFDSIGQAYLFRQCSGDGKGIAKFDSSDLADVTEPSAQGDGETKALVVINRTCMKSNSSIVYTSCLRRSARNTKPNLKNESPKPSKVANKISEFDLSSLKVLRRSRSSYAKRIRSSVWGGLVNILTDMDKSSGIGQNLGNERKRRSSKGGQGKRKSTKDQAGKKSTGKSSLPTRHISLKIKIGNKICSLGNTIESLSASGKYFSELIDTKETQFEERVSRDVVSSSARNLEKVIPSDGSALRTHLQERDPFCNQSFDTSSKFHDIRSMEEGDSLRGLSEIRCSDIGTSPDSEVINSIPDVLISEKGLPLLHDGPIVSKALVSPTDISNFVLSPKHNKGKKKVRLPQEDNCILGSKLTGAGMKNVSSLCSPHAKSKKGRKKDNLCDVGNNAETNLKGIATTNVPNGSADRVGEIYYCSDSYTRTEKTYLNGGDTNPCSGLVAISKISNSPVCGTLNPCRNYGKTPKSSSAKGRRSRTFPDEKGTSTTKKGNRTTSDIGGTGALSNAVTGPIDIMQFSSDGLREQYDLPRSAWVLCDKCQKWRRIPAELADQIEETDYGWTCHDNTDKDFADCSIPQEKSNSDINEELEISDGSFAEDDFGVAGAFMNLNEDRSEAAQQSSWTLIKSNLFLQRRRKTQTIDEVMVCNCKPPSDGRMGCGAKCLNRVLNIECVRGTCPCGELCSNQQFQNRKYAKLKWFRCGKKGYGLQALEGIPQGQFLIEYVGEVLDVHAYEARQREYAMKSHRHFYFMTLNGSEVIDACFKGNLGRFINHSCDPNCRTEKWMVNGEVCIGLFSLRDIKKGEEVTFDYNFVRVFGAAAKKCVCGSANCRGYIGGDLTNTEVIAQDDSDDEFAEPVMTCEDGEMDEDWNDIMLNNSNDREDHGIPIEPSVDIYSMKNRLGTVGDNILASYISEPSPKKVEAVNSELVAEFRIGDEFGVSFDSNSSANDVVKLNNHKTTGESLRGSMPADLQVECNSIQSQMQESSQVMKITLQSNDVNKVMSSTHEPAISVSHSKSLSDNVDSKRNLKYTTGEGMDGLAKSKSLPKTNCLLLSIKKGKPKLNALKDKVSLDVDKLSAERCRSRKLPKLPLNHHFEAVEEKLNELLDREGGISKRKDASRGYLKLLFLTAATGNNGHGEAIQSNRDLSMILDALLKTKSRTVLVDIINRNGLQMMHNILKRYRKEFIKTPILRKLLKVLEYLATREILTLEHITGGPPRPGFESFKDSVLTLAEHDDKQVHQIARNFRDKWIPRSLRKNFCIEMDDALLQYHHPSSHGGTLVSYNYWNGRGRKPSETTNSVETQSVTASGTEETSTIEMSPSAEEPKTRKRKSRWDSPVEYPHSRNRTNLVGDDERNVDEDVPPGFSNPFKGPMTPIDASSTATNHQERDMRTKLHSNVVSGEPQLRFIAHMPVSYGIPSSIMQQLGVPEAEIPEGWSIAPGMSFHPFPPLPSCAPHEADRSISARCASSSAAPIEKSGPSSDTCLTYQTDQQNKKTCSMDLSGNNVLVTNARLKSQHAGSCSLGRKYFRQQKWNPPKLPPWVRMRNGWGSAGNNARNGSYGVD